MTKANEKYDDGVTEYVTVMLDGQLFGLPIARVQDVFMPDRLTRVPLAPPEIAGVLNLRGRIVTAVDLRLRLGMAPRSDGRPPMAVGTELKGESYGLLVVDASSVIRKVARRILEGLDFQITEAEDGQQALAQCQRQLPDAVLLDWNMPVMDGYEFLKALRRLPGGDAPKVVFCTTENDVVHIARALHAGANEYIMKPFDKEIVEAKFQEVGLI